MLNNTNIVELEITTNTTASFAKNLTCIFDSYLFNVQINEDLTDARDTGDVVISIENLGLLNTTIESVYINGTYIALENFDENIFEISPLDYILLTISMIDLEAIIGVVLIGEELEIFVRTKEGAEDIHLETVVL